MPLAVLKETDTVMRRFGRENRECYVWWGGYYAGGDGQVVTAIWPEVQTEYGRIHLANQQLGILGGQLRRLDQILLLNSILIHPELAARTRWMPQTQLQPIQDLSHRCSRFRSTNLWDLRNTYVYEYIENNQWRDLSQEDIEWKFVVEPQGIGLKV